MASQARPKEYVRFHRPEGFQDLELLTAHYHDYEFAPHVHEGYVIALIEAGAERFRYRGAEHVAASGALALINPDEVHTGRRAMEAGWSYRVFYPSSGLMRELASAMAGRDPGTPFFPQAIVHDDTITAAMRELHAAMTGPSSQLERESLWLEAMGLLLQRHAPGVEPRPLGTGSGKALSRARDLLRECLEDSITLSQLSAETGLSPWHLNRMFGQRYRLPPHAYRMQVRLARARVWLQSAMPIAEIAARLGFADQAHLTRLFKRLLGMSPAAYRRVA